MAAKKAAAPSKRPTAAVEPPDPPIPVTVERVALLFGVTDKTVRSWIRAGMPVIKAGGKGKGNGALVDLAIVIQWYLDENALDVARTRLATAQSERHELDNAKARGELAVVTDVVQFISDHNAAVRAKLLAVPSKLAPQLAGINEPNVIAAGIRAEIHATLAELAEWEPAEAEPEGAARRGSRVATAADADSKPVGRRRKETQQRIER